MATDTAALLIGRSRTWLAHAIDPTTCPNRMMLPRGNAVSMCGKPVTPSRIPFVPDGACQVCVRMAAR